MHKLITACLYNFSTSCTSILSCREVWVLFLLQTRWLASLSHSQSGYGLRIPIYEQKKIRVKATVTLCKVLWNPLTEDSGLACARQGVQKNWISDLLPQHGSNTGVSAELERYQVNAIKKCVLWTELNAYTSSAYLRRALWSLKQNRDLLDVHIHCPANGGYHFPKNMDLTGKPHALHTEVCYFFFSLEDGLCYLPGPGCCTCLFYLFK